MTEAARRTGKSRLRRLVETYREILARSEEIERISRRERELLADPRAAHDLNEILSRKRNLLSAIRAEEEKVVEEREWCLRSRQSPPASCQELLSCLDAISRAMERSLALQAECRSLLGASPRSSSPGAASRGRPSRVLGAKN